MMTTDDYAEGMATTTATPAMLATLRADFDFRPRYCRCRGPHRQRRQLAEVALHSGSSTVYLHCAWCDGWTPRNPPANAGREVRCARVVMRRYTGRLADDADGCGALLGSLNIADDEAVLLRCRCGAWSVVFSTGIVFIPRTAAAAKMGSPD